MQNALCTRREVGILNLLLRKKRGFEKLLVSSAPSVPALADGETGAGGRDAATAEVMGGRYTATAEVMEGAYTTTAKAMEGGYATTAKTILMVMKLTIILLTAACLGAAAKGHTQGVSLSMKNAPLAKVFAAIEKQGFYFTYTRELLQGTKNVDVDVKNAPIKEVMNICVKDQPINYEIIDKSVVIKKRTAINDDDFLQTLPPIDIKGRIVDENGKGVVVSIQVKGTNKGTTTNDNGEFELKGVSDDAVLVISGLGIQAFEWSVDGRTDLGIINSKTKTSIGQEIKIEVQTGYQKVSKERFVGAYSQLDSAAYNRRQGMSIIDRLDGTVTGVLFDKKAGGIQIRGISTLGSLYSPTTAPLIILDNFRFTGDISSINPNDVDNITVLKDAAATSIYGAQGGNGVIVVTTKRGKYNSAFYANVRSNVTMTEKPDLFYYPQMGISDFIDLEKLLFSKGHYDATLANTTQPPPTSPVVDILEKVRKGTLTQAQADAQIDVLRGHDLRNDVNKYVNRAAVAQQYYANFGGGNNQSSYALSLGYNRILNGIKGSKPDEQYTMASNYSFRPLKNFEIQAAVNLSQGVSKSVGFSLPNLAPYAQLADANGNSMAIPYLYRLSFVDTIRAGKLLDWHYRPLDEIRLADATTRNRSINLNLSSSFRFTDWLTAMVSYNYNTALSNSRNYSNVQTFFTRDLINRFTNLSQTNPDLRNPVPVGGILNVSNSEATSYGARGQININKSWGSRHSITSLIAGEVTQSKSGGNTNRFYGYDNTLGTYKSTINYNVSYPNFFGGGGGFVPQSNTIGEGLYNRFVSVLGNASYTYATKYTLYASARRDGSNIFGVNTNNKWKPLWSVGASWMLSKEKFYHVKWLSSLRLSSSFGYTGNVNNSLAGVPTMSYSQQPATFTSLVYGQVGDAPNPDLKWEEVKIFNIAADFSVLNDRLSGRFDFFNKNINNLIAPFPFPPSSGVNQYTVNSANMKGNGFELNLNSVNTTGELKWITNFGLSHAKMKIAKLYLGSKFKANEFVGYGVNSSIGRIAYGIGSYRWAGLDPRTGDPMGYYQGQVSKNYSAIFSDSVDNQVFHGSAIPLYQGYVLNNFSWKNISVSFNITYRFAFYFRKPALDYQALFSTGQGHADYAVRWQKPGDEQHTTVPSLLYPNPATGRDQFYQYSEINVLRGDNIRVQDIRLAYDQTVRLSKNNLRQTLQFFVYPNNLNFILWRKNKDKLDPDFTGGALFAAPPPRTWTVGINMNL